MQISLNRVPTVAWLRRALRYNATAHRRLDDLQEAWLVNEKDEYGHMVSVAVIRQRMGYYSSLNYTERYHQTFRTDQQWPDFNGVPVDVQFAWTIGNDLQTVLHNLSDVTRPGGPVEMERR